MMLRRESFLDGYKVVCFSATSGSSHRCFFCFVAHTHACTDKRNVGPQQTPDWTPERIDESMKDRGKVYDWARQVRAGEIISDEFESPNIEGTLRLYSIASAVTIAFAFGRSTQTLLVDFLQMSNSEANGVVDALQGPGLAIVLASIGSSIASYILASQQGRGKLIWGLKGLLGGPPAILQLRSLAESSGSPEAP